MLGQMTKERAWRSLSMATALVDQSHTLSASQNDGRITEMTDAVSGGTGVHQYDSLSRLISAAATSSNRGLSFTCDGFGNRTAQTVTKGSAPTSSVVVDGNTNRITSSGWLYDGNGNATRMPGFSYDPVVLERLCRT